MRTIHVEVTAEDIAKARDNVHVGEISATECPVARAIRRAAHTRYVAVGTRDVRIGMFRPRNWILPREAQRLISTFDGGEECSPITFDVVLP